MEEIYLDKQVKMIFF